MSPNPLPQGVVRSADVVNEDIRALWVDPRVRLTRERHAEYMRLVAEYEEARRAKAVKAA
ncbi:hypothetical protein [Streptomyces sp. NPDC008240]|uniref:hypothetical protein n=1 Tax=Streptomyces sp. NPDC008240 TaxID=3364822 RepID=UPI0036E0F55B